MYSLSNCATPLVSVNMDRIRPRRAGRPRVDTLSMGLRRVSSWDTDLVTTFKSESEWVASGMTQAASTDAAPASNRNHTAV